MPPATRSGTVARTARNQAEASLSGVVRGGDVNGKMKRYGNPRAPTHEAAESPAVDEDVRMLNTSASSIEKSGCVVAREARRGLLYDGFSIKVVDLDSTSNYREDFEPECEDRFVPTAHLRKLDALVDAAVAEAKKNQGNVAKEFSKRLLRVSGSNEFANKRVIWRLEFEGQKHGLHCPQMKHRQYCSKLGIKTFKDLEWDAYQQLQEDAPRAPQAGVQQGERGLSGGRVEEIPNEGTVSTLVQKDWEVAAERQRIIAEQGKVVIAEEEIDRIRYALVKEKDKVRLLYGNSDIAGYKRIIGPEADSVDLSPLTHLDLLLEAAAEGVDKFKEDVVRMVRTESECPDLDLVIWLFDVEGSRTEIRCGDMKGERLRRKLNMDSLDALMACVNTRAPQTPKAQPPPATIQLNTPPSSRQPSPQQYRSERLSSSVLPSVEDATQSTSAKLYTPCLDGKEYHHIATHLPGKKQVKQDDTPCIFQVGNTEEFRLWTWKDVQELGAKLCAGREHPGKQDGEVAPCAKEWQFHEPDKSALGVVEQLGGFAKIRHKVHATPTRWNVKEKKPFTNSVLVSIDDPDVWRQVLNVRKMSNYNYEGPLRCSMSVFKAKRGKPEDSMAAVQRDTEGGEELYKYKHKPKNERGLTTRGKSRE